MNPFQWTFDGPQPILIPNGTTLNGYAGSVLTLAVNPNNACVVYAGTYVRKLWKTANCGTTWLPLSDSGPLVEIQSIWVDPVLPNAVYVLDGNGINSLYKSSDGGMTWVEISIANNPDCDTLTFAIHPTIGGTWLASEYCYGTTPNYAAIYRSTDSGATWTQEQAVNAPAGGGVIFDELQFNSGAGGYAYASGRLWSSSSGPAATLFENVLGYRSHLGEFHCRLGGIAVTGRLLR